ncbi:MAG: hypothetical protein O3C13_07870 [Bacteroidetes bacterium]|nr:hypothetical protein [Bacteroidota bacterium]
MKNKARVKSVTKKIFLIVFLCFVNIALCQRTKYLLFDKGKDSVLKKGEIEYYQIDTNLFDINRYNEIDTICKNNLSKYKFTSVNKLWKDGNDAIDSIIKQGLKKNQLK